MFTSQTINNRWSANNEMSERAICGFIISILKSLVIPGIWLAVSSMIYLRITLFFALNHICSKWRHSCSKSHHFFFKTHYFRSLSHHLCFKYKMRCKSLFVITVSGNWTSCRAILFRRNCTPLSSITIIDVWFNLYFLLLGLYDKAKFKSNAIWLQKSCPDVFS